MSECHSEFSIGVLHPIRFFYEDVDGQFPVLFFPCSFLLTRVNDRLDVVLDIPPLPTLVMQGNRAENQRVEDALDIRFWSAGDAYAQIRKLGFDEFPNEA